MVGKQFLYNGIQYTITGIYEDGDDMYGVVTNKRTFRLPLKAVKEQFLPVEEQAVDKLALYGKLTTETIPLANLSTTLMETVERVKTDPKYLDQARAINETARTLIELGKTQLEALRLVKELA
jgi:hypothetical protein